MPPHISRRVRTSALPFSIALLFLLTACAVSRSPETATATPTRAPATATPPADAWTPLRQRALHLPTLTAGAPCPLSPTHTVSAHYGPVSGDGPAYPILGAYAVTPRPGVLEFGPPANFHSQQWGGQKVLWVVAPSYSGPVLIRGHQVDGPNEVRFGPAGSGDPPPAELAFSALNGDPNGWSGEPSYTRLRTPGCYAYQADGTSFTTVIVFQAVPQS